MVAPCSLVVKKREKAPKIGEKKAAVQFGSVPPYNLVVIECAKDLKFRNKKKAAVQYGSVRVPPLTVG